MREFSPFLNTGILVLRPDDVPLGSCFVFRYPNRFITAAHCVRDRRAAALAIRLPTTAFMRPFEIGGIVLHPQADLAVLEVPTISEDDITWPQYLLCDDRALGTDFAACGYPQDYNAHGPQLTPRFFKGYFQRFYHHASHHGYRYVAAELNIGCPAGLSGAPVFHAGFQGRLYGVVTENRETATERESMEEVEKDGATNRYYREKVINYGTCVWLPAVAEWLDQVVPPVPDEEIARRGANQQRLREQRQRQPNTNG